MTNPQLAGSPFVNPQMNYNWGALQTFNGGIAATGIINVNNNNILLNGSTGYIGAVGVTRNSTTQAFNIANNAASQNVAILQATGKLGIFGATPVVKQSATDLPTLLTALQNYGLI